MQTVIRGHQLLARIGTGAQSEVYRARDISTGETVALKRVMNTGPGAEKPLRHLTNEYHRGHALLDAAKREGRPLPHLVEIHDLLRERGLLRLRAKCLLMDYVPGRTLEEYADYPLPMLLKIFAQVCDGLEFMHAHGLVHADIKPNNIIVDRGGKATVIDLGFCVESGAKGTSVKGTLHYIAPEQTNGGILGPKTDLYNLGAAMYKVLAGRPLSDMPRGEWSDGFLASHALKATPVHAINPDVPADVSALVEACTKRQPAKRAQSAMEVGQHLRELALVMEHRRKPLAQAV